MTNIQDTFPKILEDRKQLKGKTISLIEDAYAGDDAVIYYTEDNCLLIETQQAYEKHGMLEIEKDYITDLLDAYSMYGYYLTYFSILSEEQEAELDSLLSKRRHKEAEEINKQKDKKDYKKYLELKKRFGED